MRLGVRTKARCQMSLRGVIRKSDRTALGSVADVQLQLSRVFAGVRFVYFAEEPPGAIEARTQMSLALRLWLTLFGVDGRYPAATATGSGGSIWVAAQLNSILRRMSPFDMSARLAMEERGDSTPYTNNWKRTPVGRSATASLLDG